MPDKPTPSARQVAMLTELVRRYDLHSDYYTSPSGKYNEHSCRDDFINEFLVILGWDVGNTKGIAPQYREVVAENYSSESERPDYTLTISGSPVFFVEAKKPSVDILRESDASLQARKYGWNAGHSIAVLTNFEDLVIFDATVMPKQGDSASVARYKRYNHSEYVSFFNDIYALLSRDSVYGGYFELIAEQQFPYSGSGTERVDRVFLGQINQWRLLIANSLLKNSESFSSEERLNDAVQDFINQIIFLRICEDKNLPVYHRLCELDATNVDASILELLKAADRRYNSGLFSETSAIRFIDNSVVSNIIEALYYPQSPYLFDIIDSNIFGQIYEMFLSERVIISENGKAELAKKREYRDRSVVSTPSEIARYIVARALSPLCAGKTPDEIKRIRCADIACGSGIFLIEAFQYLMDACLDWRYKNDPTTLVAIGGGRYKLALKEKKEILSSCLYGIDIDSHAVEIAKFSLLIKLIEEETTPTVAATQPILPNIDSNIIVGNALVSPNEARASGATARDFERIIPLDWNLINGGMAFHAIFGNPPYVKTEDLHSLLSTAEFAAYKHFYKSSYRQFDKYYLFIERAIHLLAPGGHACFIVPNKFFKIASGKMLRKIISAGKFLESIDDFGDAQLFDDKTIYSSIVCLQKSAHHQFDYSTAKLPGDLWRHDDGRTIRLDEAALGDAPWRLTTDLDFLKMLKALDEVAVPLSKHVEVFNGIQTSAEQQRTYWFLNSEIISKNDTTITFRRSNQSWTIERDIMRPYFKPTENHGFNSYSLLTCDKWLIFPYDNHGHLIPIETMKSRYPGAWSYLLSRKAELWPKQLGHGGRRDVQNATLETWYQYGRTQALTAFNGQDKIIVGILSEQPLYYIDRENWVIASGGTAGYCGIKMKPSSPYSLEYVQAWLTNYNTEKLFDMIGSNFEGGFRSRGTSLLRTLPFVELDLEKSSQRSVYDEIITLSRRVEEINKELRTDLSHRAETVLVREKNEAVNRIATLVDDIYSLKVTL